MNTYSLFRFMLCFVTAVTMVKGQEIALENVSSAYETIAKKSRYQLVVETSLEANSVNVGVTSDTERLRYLAELCSVNNTPPNVVAALTGAIKLGTVSEYIKDETIVIADKASGSLKADLPFDRIVDLPKFNGTMKQLCVELKKQNIDLSAGFGELGGGDRVLYPDEHHLDIPSFKGTLRDLLIKCSRAGAKTYGYYALYFPKNKSIAVNWIMPAARVAPEVGK
jgi:hypothetical protein